MPVLAVPGFVLIVAALFALLILLGSGALKSLLVNLFNLIPVVGGTIAKGVSDNIDTAVAIARAFLDPMVAPLARAITAPVAFVQGIVDGIVGTIHALHNALDALVTVSIPTAIRNLDTAINRAYSNAVTYTGIRLVQLAKLLQGHIDSVRAYAEAVAAAAAAATAQAYADAIRYAGIKAVEVAQTAERHIELAREYAYQLAQSVAAAAAAATAAVLAEAQHLVAALDARLTARIAQVEGEALTWAREAEAAAVTAVDTTAAAALRDVWPDVIAGVQAVEGVIATDLPDIQAALRAVDLTVPGSLEAALAGVGALTVPMLRYLERCGIPNCRNLSQFGRDLQNMVAAADSVVFLEWIVALVRDPAGGAQRVVDAVEAPVEAIRHGVAELTGLGV